MPMFTRLTLVNLVTPFATPIDGPKGRFRSSENDRSRQMVGWRSVESAAVEPMQLCNIQMHNFQFRPSFEVFLDPQRYRKFVSAQPEALRVTKTRGRWKLHAH